MNWPADFSTLDAGRIVRHDDAYRGYGLRGYDADRPHLWRLSMALQFQTVDERYLWLSSLLALWEGRFDEITKTARYRAFAQSPECAGVEEPSGAAGRK